ncbi:hypothetical protein GH714_043247 [Hevea brasiliensis]|uniref:Uncharacterized protein n=1 Tax=Hevea brasiliensis TaxID=3981 RepID=A0A6A6K2B9_HEVBR|nr:hypothetical protein GH714_043247 [Hevea brasiliensis]
MNGKEGNADQVKYAVNEEDNWHASKLDGSMGVDDSTSDNEKEVRDFVAPTPLTHSSLKIESFEKNKVFYVDKSVMESELPELVVCYRDSAYHIVKDICIDEGVPSQDRFLFDPGVSEENLCTILPPEDINSEIAKERVNLDAFIPDDMKPSAKKEKSTLYLPIPDVLISTEEKGSKNEFSLECDFKKLIPVGETEVDSKEEIANVASKEIFSFGQLLLTPEAGTELSQPESTHNSIGETELQSVQRPCENTIMAMASGCEESENGNEQVLVVNPVVYAAEESDFGHQEAVLGTLALDSTAKASDHGHDETVVASNALNFTTEGLENGSSGDKMTSHNGVSVSQSTRKIEDESSCNNRVETKIITFNSLSSPPTASGGDDSQNCGSGRTETCSFLPEETSTEPLSSQLQYSLGETSFSAAVPLSAMASRVDEVQFSLPAATLPRKLRVILDEKAAPVNDHKSQGSTSSDILQRGDISGKPYQKEENVLRGSRGTRQEWAEGTDTSQYFTMDYSHVRRRRPIHNKALPVGP